MTSTRPPEPSGDRPNRGRPMSGTDPNRGVDGGHPGPAPSRAVGAGARGATPSAAGAPPSADHAPSALVSSRPVELSEQSPRQRPPTTSQPAPEAPAAPAQHNNASPLPRPDRPAATPATNAVSPASTDSARTRLSRQALPPSGLVAAEGLRRRCSSHPATPDQSNPKRPDLQDPAARLATTVASTIAASAAPPPAASACAQRRRIRRPSITSAAAYLVRIHSQSPP